MILRVHNPSPYCETVINTDTSTRDKRELKVTINKLCCIHVHHISLKEERPKRTHIIRFYISLK